MNDIVKDSEALKQAILARIEELGITNGQIAEDAKKRGMTGFTERGISVWKHHPRSKGALNQLQVIWLSFRLGIRVSLKIGEPIIENGKLRYIVPVPFDENKALKELNQIFPPIQSEPTVELKENIIKKKRK